jgi:anti-sigma28 factor (negative regulator of flagellin synthesis)
MSVRLILALLITGVAMCSQALAQDTAAPPQFRSRSEYSAERRKTENAFPEVVRALRTLHLPPDKLREAEAKLTHSEVETRSTHEELELLTQKAQTQDYGRRSDDSARVAELRTNLQKSTDQLHSEIKTLLTPQQRVQFDKYMRRQIHERGPRPLGSH